MRELKNDYTSLKKDYAPGVRKKITGNPLFGYVVTSIVLIVIQLLYMAGLIPLNVSQAIMQTMIYVVAGMGVGILLWLAGLMSFATGAFIGLGTYLAAYILKSYMVPFVLILAIVAVVGVVAGVVVGFISLRVKGVNLLIITLALATVMSTMYALPNDFTGGPTGVSKVPFPELAMLFETSRDTMYFVILVVMFLLILPRHLPDGIAPFIYKAAGAHGLGTVVVSRIGHGSAMADLNADQSIVGMDSVGNPLE